MALEPREYQKNILETAKKANTLVVLPTGVGKTLIALMLTTSRLEEHPGSKALILAPTRPLVEQHQQSFIKNLPELFGEIALFTGEVPVAQRKKIWSRADVIFSTPQCIANDVGRGIYSLEDVSLLVIDEAHRCLKNYDYTKVASAYKNQALNQRIMGLTASPGSEHAQVKQICDNLGITEVEIRSRDSEDVKPYVEELDFKKIEVPFPPELIEIRTLLKQIYNQKVDQLRQRSLLFGPTNKIALLKLQTSLARQASSGNGNAMYGMSLTAQAIKIAHALELIETQTVQGTDKYLEELAKQAAEKKTRGVQQIVNSREFNAARISLSYLKTKNQEHPKISKVCELVKAECNENDSAKVLIFTQFRETAQVIIEKIKRELNLPASIFVGQAKKLSGGMSQKEQKNVVEAFRNNELRVLCATSIGEEGLDIPEVSMVIFYEPIPSAIRKIQRAGRTARHAPGKLMILITKDTKDEINHYASTAREKKMYKTVEAVKKEIKDNPKTINDFL